MAECKVLVTGSKGFIAKNLLERLSLLENIVINTFNRNDDSKQLTEKMVGVKFVFHLAGVNRPDNPQDFYTGNRDLTQDIVDAVNKNGGNIPILMTSSSQAECDNDYGKSKREGEEVLMTYNRVSRTPISIYRLPNVFGRGCRPNYNSVVATWCYNIAHGLPIHVNDETVTLKLVYIDDVVDAFIKQLGKKVDIAQHYYKIKPIYQKQLTQIHDLLIAFEKGTLSLEGLSGFDKALYVTYKNYADEMGC